VNNQRFIKSLNSIANNYTFAVKAPIPTVLYTAEPMEEDAPVSESNDYSFFYWLAGAFLLSAGAAALWARSQNIEKFKECSKLINRHLKDKIKNIIKEVVRSIFNFSPGDDPQRALALGLPELLRKLREVWNSFSTNGGSGISKLNQLVDGYRPNGEPMSDDDLKELRGKLRDCIKSFPGLIKDILKKYVTDRLGSNIPQDLLDKLRFAIDKYFNDGDLEAFAYAFVIAVGSAMTTSLAVDAATLIVAGFSDTYGVGTTVLVSALAAALVALSTFLIGGGSLATLGAWLASTAASAAASAATAAGATLNPAALQMIKDIIEKIVRQIIPAT
jgi:hypothetical protein